MLKIAFHTPKFCVRGTSTALYDYGNYNETLLNNRSVIIAPKSSLPDNDQNALLKFSERFKVLFYDDKEDMERLISDCDIFYCIKYGTDDGIKSDTIKTVVHCVFDLSQPHGNVYAAVSKTLANKYGSELFVPHMIGLKPSFDKENLRIVYGIPEDAIVFGRHGGEDTFDLEFARNAIRRIVREVPNVYFVFVNTPVFDDNPKIFFFPKIVSSYEKNLFIQTCDAHLECGRLGHSFGLSMGEFSVNNKPIIAYNGPTWNTAHIDILKDKALYYNDEESFYNILSTFKPEEWENKDNNCYRDYTPEKVMEQFKTVFID